MGKNQRILLKPDQIEALAMQFEQAANDFRSVLAQNQEAGIWLQSVESIDTILEASDQLISDLRRSAQEENRGDPDLLQDRSGRPRRTRRRKP